MPSSTAKAATINITLPDGSVRPYAVGTTGQQFAESIGAGLAKAALAMTVNGIAMDLSEPITTDAAVAILTAKDPQGVDIMRHTLTAQILALAIKELFPNTRLAIGPTIDNGFYYDVASPTPLSVDDLPRLEKKMNEILDRGLPVRRIMMPVADAIALFSARGESYKTEIIKESGEKKAVSVYRQGDGDDAFVDLCRGPHVPHFSKLSRAFKLTKVAGAYWRGDSTREMLTRIYGVAFATQKELDAHLHMIEEAEKRDHRKLGTQMNLFHMQDDAVGSVFWHDRGWTLYRTIENYIRRKLKKFGYTEVRTPMLVDRKLWETSGHWEKFQENMFTSNSDKDRVLALKPMNCPCHVQIFNIGTKSYRDLPIRMAEFGSCHRNEASGALHGLIRVRSFVQDDAHIFCTPDQILSESESFCRMLSEVYTDFGFTDVRVKLSTRPEKRAGTDATWDRAERELEAVLKHLGLAYDIQAGEGAFYGPKMEFHLKDAIGRSWQCGTLQLDFVLPERLGAVYTDENNQKQIPVMLHRAILGSLERFIGILIESHAGKFPLWLAPVQVVVANITDSARGYAESIYRTLNALDVRTVLDTRGEKINYKIREHSHMKVPLIAVVGQQEAEATTVAVRTLGGETQDVMPFAIFVERLQRDAVMPL